MTKKIIFFDLDGTLTDPFEGVAKGIEYALTKLKKLTPSREALKICIGPPLHHSFARLLEVDLENPKVNEAIDFYREYYKETGLFENEVYSNMASNLKILSQKYDLYVATSKPQPFAEHVLEHFAIDSFFKGVCGSELDGSRSDKAEIMNKLLVDFSLNSENILMIGDRLYDMEGAKKNNFKTLGVLWGYGSIEELTQAGADLLVEKTEDLLLKIEEVLNS